MLDIMSYILGKQSVVIPDPPAPQSDWELIGSKTVTANTSSTTASKVDDITYKGELTKNDVVWVHVRDVEGKRNERFYGSDSVIMLVGMANNVSQTENRIFCSILKVDSNGVYGMNYTPNGVYPTGLNPTDKFVTISKKYSSSYTLTIDSDYVVEIYKLKMPTGVTLFE